MKLRNKNTGEVIDLDIANIKAQFGGISVIPEPVKLGGDEYVYHSLAELNDDWEDYKPAEPLIKDEKIRKAIRAWAEANNIRAVYYSPEEDGFYVKNFDDEIVASIYFGDKPIEEDGYGEHYTIAELCGEEE